MPKKKYAAGDRTNELLERLLAVQLYSLGAPRDQIARMIGRSKESVVAMLKGIQKKGN